MVDISKFSFFLNCFQSLSVQFDTVPVVNLENHVYTKFRELCVTMNSTLCFIVGIRKVKLCGNMLANTI